MTVPIELFGRDHWATFAYLETRVVDHDGRPARRHMRCHWERHPFFRHEGGDAKDLPTRLRVGRLLGDHDDWDCAEDLEEAGLLENVGTGVNPVYRMTPRGEEIASRLRVHKGRGGAFDEFFVGALPTIDVTPRRNTKRSA